MTDNNFPIFDKAYLARIQSHRIEQIQKWLVANDCPAVVLFDPVNIRYATGTRNTQVWTMHNFCRYAVVFASGDIILFELPSSSHLSRDLVEDIRPALSFDHVIVGNRGCEMARRWVVEMREILVEKGYGEGKLAIRFTAGP